jgi:hypothetical protein
MARPPSSVGLLETLLAFISEVLVSNLGGDIDYPELYILCFPQLLQAIPFIGKQFDRRRNNI